jgi:hypothetical protein
MTSCVKYPAALAANFLWIGFVCAISFMEAWLKFRAPGIMLPLGLCIGKLVFNALKNGMAVFNSHNRLKTFPLNLPPV